MSGFGRTGEWLALNALNVVLDLITLAKGENSGYVPAGGVMISAPIAHHFDERLFRGRLTYPGDPLVAAGMVRVPLRTMKSSSVSGWVCQTNPPC
ncbi:aminotransferase class III-fold pyridoxal phosphate-dependent enzyme [Salinibacterium sp.]|uniref:aminotransferase class III-fold pyridoxal phosphate-dependent enzyme n=1 Tax=Salinibacterium sp. TaxID=1915057 RepID=UPI00286CBFA6|nr:aminotransferase class III-fold pyridoxal phosphate-dependent enzyme [Salinibacterium sp.]